MNSLRLQKNLTLNILEIQLFHNKDDFIASISESLFLKKLLPNSNLIVIENI